MATYGAELADWIADFPPLAALSYLADVARIEQACREASQSADAAPLAPGTLAACRPKLWRRSVRAFTRRCGC